MAAGLRLRHIFDGTFWVMAALAALSGVACYAAKGPEAFFARFKTDLELLGLIVPRGPPAHRRLHPGAPAARQGRPLARRPPGSRNSLATGAGMVTPGGPMTSFLLVSALHQAGTGRRALVAYLTSWSTQGFQRILMWEVPPGPGIRGLPLPGLVAPADHRRPDLRHVPIETDPPSTKAP